MSGITLDGKAIGIGQPPYVVAEMSGNHNHSLERALEIVEAAAAAGASAIKLQTYTADTMTLDVDRGAFRIEDPASLWAGRTLYELYQQAYTPWEWHGPIFERARQLGLTAFSSPFDATAVDFLESLAAPAYKIASFENTDLPLIRRVAATGKPVIISVGMATRAEVDEAVQAARGAGCRDLILLKCTSAYPSEPESANLRTIAELRRLFGVEAGLSDHTMGIGVSVAAVALGATCIEKHFTLRRADGGVDSAFSMEPAELRQLVEECGRAARAVGDVTFGASEKERQSLLHRRSLYIVADMEPGEAFTAQNLRAIRPGDGLAPKHYEALVGRTVGRRIAKGTPASWDLLGDA
jgi:pseudaminic acid synthase